MKRQYIFLILIIIILYILYLILSYKYREYKINTHIEYLSVLKGQIETSIKDAEDIIAYKTTKAYKNKILKEQQGLKNRGEQVVYLTSEEKYEKFTQAQTATGSQATNIEDTMSDEQKKVQDMKNIEKWMYFLFKVG